MSHTLQLVQQLVARGEIRISEHGYDELSADKIGVRDIIQGMAEAVLVEDYPDYFKGPCMLYCKKTKVGWRFMSFGEFQRMKPRRPSS